MGRLPGLHTPLHVYFSTWIVICVQHHSHLERYQYLGEHIWVSINRDDGLVRYKNALLNTSTAGFPI